MGHVMTNFVGMDVLALFGIKHPDEVNSDEDYFTGRITAKVGNKVRVVWNRTSEVEYLKSDILHKLDKDTAWYVADNTDNSDTVHITDLLPAVREAYIADKTDEAVQEALSGAEQDEPDLNDNTGNPDNTDVAVKPAPKARTRRTTTK